MKWMLLASALAFTYMMIFRIPCALGQNMDGSYEDKVKARLERIQSQQKKSRDYSLLSAEEVLRHALGNNPRDPISEKLVADEFASRPDELKMAVLKVLFSPNASLEQLYHIPHWAKYISTDFQIDVAKKAIFHPAAVNSKGVFVDDPYFCEYFDSDPTTKKEVVNKLIDQGRMTLDGNSYKWWHMKPNERPHLRNLNNSKKVDHRDTPSREAVNKADQHSASDDGASYLSLPIFIGASLLLIAAVFYIFSRKEKCV